MGRVGLTRRPVLYLGTRGRQYKTSISPLAEFPVSSLCLFSISQTIRQLDTSTTLSQKRNSSLDNIHSITYHDVYV